MHVIWHFSVGEANLSDGHKCARSQQILYQKELYLYDDLQTRPWERAPGARAERAEGDPPRCAERARSAG